MADRVVESSDKEVPEIPDLLERVLVYVLSEARSKLEAGEEVAPFTALAIKDKLFIETHPADRGPLEIGPEPTERIHVDIDHRHRMASFLEAPGQHGTDAATTHDHDVHLRLPPGPAAPGRRSDGIAITLPWVYRRAS